MANYRCKCGNRLNNSLVPNDIELRVYTDKQWDDIINIGMMDSADMPDPSIDVWRCPLCERVYVFEGNHLIKYYVLHDMDELGEP